MERYARRFSAVGFALAAWYGYVLGSLLWQSWDGHGLIEFPDLLSLVVLLGAIAFPSGAAVLLRRLAAPGHVSFSVSWLARLWFVFGLCGAVGCLLSLWSIATASNFYAYLASVQAMVSLAFILASAIFFLAILPPLWGLSRRPPAPMPDPGAGTASPGAR